MIDIDRLEALAAPLADSRLELREHSGNPNFPVYTLHITNEVGQLVFTDYKMPDEWMCYAAAANPQTVLALCAEVRLLRAMLSTDYEGDRQ